MPNYVWPIPLYRAPGVERVSDEWGPRAAPVPGASTFHRGIDMGWCAGMIYGAPAGGVITHVGWNGGEGFSIHMLCDDDTLLKFFHSVADSAFVVEGQRVAQLDPLAVVGDTGVSGGPHLHWEVWIGETQNVNPRIFMQEQTDAAGAGQTPLEDEFMSAISDEDQIRMRDALLGNDPRFDNIDVLISNVQPVYNALLKPSDLTKPFKPIDVIVSHVKANLTDLTALIDAMGGIEKVTELYASKE